MRVNKPLAAVKTALVFLLIPSLFPVASIADLIVVPREFPTIQEAIDFAEPGDTIRVLPGDFAGALIDKRVAIRGAGLATQISSGVHGSSTAFALTGDSDGAEISNLLIAYNGLARGVFAIAINDVTLDKLTIVDAYHPIETRRGNGWTITHNSILGLVPPEGSSERHCDAILVWATHLGASTNNLVAYNEIVHQGNAVGGFVEEFYAGIVLVSSGRQITNNTVIHNRVLLSVAGADYLAGITLLDYSAKAGGPVLAVDNIIKHNNLRFSDLGVDLAPDFLDQFNDLRFNVSRDGW